MWMVDDAVGCWEDEVWEELLLLVENCGEGNGVCFLLRGP